MVQTVSQIMTPDPLCVDEATPLREVAMLMRDHDVGDVIVLRNGTVGGIVTDRDIVVRGVAEGENVGTTHAGDICSGDVVTISPRDLLDDALATMSDYAVRRLPVVDAGRPVGILSLGDVAPVDEDAESALAEISVAPPND